MAKVKKKAKKRVIRKKASVKRRVSHAKKRVSRTKKRIAHKKIVSKKKVKKRFVLPAKIKKNIPQVWALRSRSGKLYVLTGPSGAGKTTIAAEILKEIKFFKKIVTCTTRLPRGGEINNVHYHFLSKNQFEQNIKENKMFEYAVFDGNYYGSLRSEVKETIESGKSVLFVVDIQGALTIKKNYPSSIIIFIKTPDLKILKERLIARAKDSYGVIEERIKIAQEELKKQRSFKYIIVNDDLNEAVEKTKDIILENLRK